MVFLTQLLPVKKKMKTDLGDSLSPDHQWQHLSLGWHSPILSITVDE